MAELDFGPDNVFRGLGIYEFLNYLIKFLNDHWRKGKLDNRSLTVHWPPELVKVWGKLTPDVQESVKRSFSEKSQQKGFKDGVIGNWHEDYYCRFRSF